MALPAEKQNPLLMREMFSTVAPRYDFVTRAFSYGMDGRWKRILVEKAQLPPAPLVLDLACGTGDFSVLVARRRPGAHAVAADLTERMLGLARSRGIERAVCADAGRLPFPDALFDCVCVGYGLRNFLDLDRALAEIARVTRPGGLFLSLDFFLPGNRLLRNLYLAYLYAQGAVWGFLLHGAPRVYTYVPASLKTFLSIGAFSTRLRRAGYGRIEQRSRIFGGIGLHWAARE